jgi:hypothetical protein
MPELLTGGITRGAEKAFTVTELRRAAVGAASALLPTGVRFVWTRETFSVPRGAWQFQVKQRTVREDYPGSEEPVEQVLGWNYEAFTLNGCWDDRYGGAGFALKTWQDFELLVKRGNPVRLEFQNVSITGLITNVNFSYKRRDYIEYSFGFSPHFRTPKETIKVLSGGAFRPTLDPKTVAKLARAQLEALMAAQALARAANLSRVQSILSSDIFREITADLDAIAAQIAKVDNIVNEQITSAQNAANAFLRAVQIFSSIKSMAASTLTRIQHLQSTVQLGVQTAVTTLDFEVWHRSLGARLRDLIVGSDNAQKQLRPRAHPSVKRLHRAKKGESLYAISQNYYGTPHRWREILQRNGLTKVILDGGELLVIPE